MATPRPTTPHSDTSWGVSGPVRVGRVAEDVVAGVGAAQLAAVVLRSESGVVGDAPAVRSVRRVWGGPGTAPAARSR